jgi:hypothetical protein
MSYKFSGCCSKIEIKNYQVLYDYNDDTIYDCVIGEEKNISDFLNFSEDILPTLENNKSAKHIEDGFYYVYFTGLAEFGSDQDWETGVYEGWVEITLDYVNWEKLIKKPESRLFNIEIPIKE